MSEREDREKHALILCVLQHRLAAFAAEYSEPARADIAVS